MRDFLGREIKVGDFVAYPGGGNTACEYGLLLMKVVAIGSSVKCERLDVDYTPKKAVRVKTSNIQNTNKLVCIENVPEEVKHVFNNPTEYIDVIGKWIHGKTDNVFHGV